MPSEAGKPIVTRVRISVIVLVGLLISSSFGTAAKTINPYFTVPIDDDFQVHYAMIPRDFGTHTLSIAKVYLKAFEYDGLLVVCGYYVEEESLYVDSIDLRTWFDDDGYLFVNGEAVEGTHFLLRGQPAVSPEDIEAGCWTTTTRYRRDHRESTFGIVHRRDLDKFLPDR